MKSVRIKKCTGPFSGTLSFPGDKSLSHRAIIFGSLAEGTSHFTNVLAGEDCECTRRAFQEMGVRIESKSGGTDLTIQGVGLKGLKAPKKELYLGNSGTSMRLLMGILAGQKFSATLTGDPSLSSRPMKRVTDPLRKMGANIEGKDDGNLAPITVHGGELKGIDYKMPVASAQVKSAILLAGLYAQGATRVTEPVPSRDHTERFLKFFGSPRLSARSFEIAGDISSAAFFMALAALTASSDVSFKNVLWNPTRRGSVEAMKRMGVAFKEKISDAKGPEITADFAIAAGSLTSFEVKKAELPSLIDEIPILCVLATQAKGESVIHEADELRVKESDRIEAILGLLKPMGADIRAEGNTIFIKGPTKLKGAVLNSRKDHRIAMSGVVAGLIAEGETAIEDIDCINTSFPGFFERLKLLKVPFELRG